jgi:signal transduction histidine kinase
VLQQAIAYVDALTLSYQDDIFSFEFAALSYANPEKNRYRYKLEGLEPDWNEVNSKQRLAIYTNLDPGHYVFRVQASNNDGVWNEAGVSVPITITPPWWGRWWFRSAAAAALLALAFGGYQWRVSNIERRSQELERQVAERTAQLKAANKELEAFAYSVSHDLRTPLRHVDGFLELLQQRTAGTLDERSQHYMDTISDSARRMGQLIDDLLTFSRMGRNEMIKTSVDLGALVAEVIGEFAPETQGRTVNWHIASLPIVTGDRAMLRLALVNLLSNALKFTRQRQPTEIEIGCLPNQDNEIIVFVRDNGVGFDMAYADKLFGVFQRLHLADEFEGTGIGLANIRRIVQRHGGRVWAEGIVNQGATFYVSLPHKTQG